MITTKRKYEDLYEFSYKMRKRFLEIFTTVGFGHVTSAFSMTEIVVALYKEILRYNTARPDWAERDRFVLSKGHGAGMLFPIFEEIGFFTKEEINDMVRIGGNFHELRKYFYPGFEFYGGSLGQGLGIAAGLATGARLNRENWQTYCILGDAECYEGSVWEAILYAGHNRLNNLVAIVDRNVLGCSEFTEDMISLEPFSAKWRSCNWNVKSVDGHCYEELISVLQESRLHRTDKPLCIIANTIKGKGLEYLYNKPLMHGYMPKEKDDIELAFRELKSY